MTIEDVRNEIVQWRFTRYKAINLAIGACALLLHEFVARPYYRPFIYTHNIYDYHIADTLGSTLGTVAAVFIMVALLSREKKDGYFLIKIVTLSLVVFELAHPLLGKPIDPWDVAATIITGGLCYFLFKLLRFS